MADRIALIFEGELHQFSSSKDFYEQPSSRRIAHFFGNSNIIDGRRNGDIVTTSIGNFKVRNDLTIPDGDLLLLVRPEAIEMDSVEENSFETIINRSIYMGTHTRYQIEMDGNEWNVIGSSQYDPGFEEGSHVRFTLPKDKIWLLEREERTMNN